MALIACPECKKSVSDRASFCPQCGCPIAIPNSDDTSPTNIEQSPEAPPRDAKISPCRSCGLADQLSTIDSILSTHNYSGTTTGVIEGIVDFGGSEAGVELDAFLQTSSRSDLAAYFASIIPSPHEIDSGDHHELLQQFWCARCARAAHASPESIQRGLPAVFAKAAPRAFASDSFLRSAIRTVCEKDRLVREAPPLTTLTFKLLDPASHDDLVCHLTAELERTVTNFDASSVATKTVDLDVDVAVHFALFETTPLSASARLKSVGMRSDKLLNLLDGEESTSVEVGFSGCLVTLEVPIGSWCFFAGFATGAVNICEAFVPGAVRRAVGTCCGLLPNSFPSVELGLVSRAVAEGLISVVLGCSSENATKIVQGDYSMVPVPYADAVVDQIETALANFNNQALKRRVLGEVRSAARRVLPPAE